MKDKSYYKDAPAYGAYFFDLIETNDLLAEFDKSRALTLEVIASISPEQENYSYQPGKWTTKEVLRHIIDMERVFAYRAFRFSRLDKTNLSGVEQTDYISNAHQKDVPLSDIKEEYLIVRNATVLVYKHLSEEMLNHKGLANNQTYTAKTLGFGMIGHNIHHCRFIQSHYLKSR